MMTAEPITIPPRNRWLILAVLCSAVFTILVDTNIVNVALPSLVGELDASNRDLLWIVDAYNLFFAAFVLAAGSLADRYGRRRMLLAGLTVFGLATTVGAFLDSAPALTAARAVMGLGAAMIFPTTLSILTNVFPDRGERAKAIGVWGATTGIAIAVAPIVGGWLLDEFWWGSVFLAMAPPALVAFVLVLALVPESRNSSTPPLDKPGLVLSTLGLGALVFTIIEAPDAGWASARSLAGFAVAAVVLAAFVLRERGYAHPMLDVALFRNLRFSAASLSVTASFFALFGFIFLITQYMQFLRGYSPLETGVRVLPVAVAVASSSVLSASFVVRLGNKVVIASGLALMGVGFLWISGLSTGSSYLEIAGQMIVVGFGMGLTTAPATEAIMGVVPPEKAGIGSAVNDATREVGGTLGVAVIGSVFASLYTSHLDDQPVIAALGGDGAERARDGVGAALGVAARLGESDAATALVDAASRAYFAGLQAGCFVAAAVALAGSAFAARFLPARPNVTTPSNDIVAKPEGVTV